MQLTYLIVRYVASRNRHRPIGNDLSPATVLHLENSVKHFAAWLHRKPLVSDLVPSTLNKYLTDSVHAPRSAKSRRTALLVLMRYARRRKLITHSARRVRPIACPPLDVQGYTPESMQTLVAYLQSRLHTVRGTGIPKSIYWSSLALTQWNIGLRIGDFTRVRVRDFNPEGWLWAKENKTKKETWLRLHPSTTEAIRLSIAASPNREMIWPGMMPESLSRAFSRLAREAGVSGTSQWVRRGASSAVEQTSPGNGWRFLRHSSPKVFDEHYRIAKVCDAALPLPPDVMPPRLTG
jgi:integrase